MELQNSDLAPETCTRTLEGRSLTAPGWHLESHPSARPKFRPRYEGCPLQSNSQVGRSQKRPCTITKSPSATIVPGSCLSVGGMLLTRLNRPSRPGEM